MKRRRRVFQKKSLEKRLAERAQRFKQQAKTLPAGRDREIRLRRARQAETAAQINDWLTSLGLQPPKSARP
jgi:hypothetical protein